MITKEIIKSEVDRVEDQYLDILYRIVKSFETQQPTLIKNDTKELEWHSFIKRTYGSLAHNPIAREPQGEFEIREELK